VDSHLPGTYFSFYGPTQHKVEMHNSTALLSDPRATGAVEGTSIFRIIFRHGYHHTVSAVTSQNTISFTYVPLSTTGISNLHDESRKNK